jgi:hypothetical protein
VKASSPPATTRTGPRSAWLASAFFVVATLIMTWPLVTGLGRYVSDPGDPYFSAWVLHWDWHQLFRDPLHLFDADIFYPSRLTLAFSENMLGIALFGFPLFAAGVPVIAVYNVLFLAGMALSGLGAWALARELCGDSLSALVAGVLYEFVPYRFDHLAHIQLQWGGFLPLALLFLWRYARDARRRDAAAFSLFFVLNGLCCIYYQVFGLFAVAITLLVAMTHWNRWRERRVLRGALWAFVAAGAALAPVYAPYAVAAHLYGFHRSLGEGLPWSASLASFLSAGFHNKLYSGITAAFAAPENQLFPGLIAPILATLGLAGAFHEPRPERLSPGPRGRPLHFLDGAIVLAVVARLAFTITGGYRIGRILSVHEPYRTTFLLAVLVGFRLAVAFPRGSAFRNVADLLRRSRLGPERIWALGMLIAGILLAFGPKLFFYQGFAALLPFVFGAVRGCARAVVLLHLGLGTLAAIGVAKLRVRIPARRSLAVVGAILLLELFEFRAAPIAWATADTQTRPVYAWLRSQRFPGGVLELPIRLGPDTSYVLRTTEHGHPILNGYSGFFPTSYLSLKNAFDQTPIASDALRKARVMGCRVVLFHSGEVPGERLIALAAFLRAGVASGALRPLAVFPDPSSEDPCAAFALTHADGADQLASLPNASRNAARLFLSPERRWPVPEGWYDTPKNGEVLRGGEIRSTGWAASQAGIRRIAVVLDGKDVGTATYGTRRPDVPRVKPYVACGESCGYSFRVVGVAPGRHQLRVVYIGRNGKEYSPPPVEFLMRP